MIHRRTFIAGLALAAGIASFTPAIAAEPFTQPAFEAAQSAGKPILVEITAPWCSTCKAQKPILANLAAQPDLAEMVVLEVDFDSQKDVVRGFRAQMQSTLIVFKGDTEVGRSVGDTNPASIEALLRSAI